MLITRGIFILILFSLLQTGCATRTKQTLTAGAVGAAVGAGVGYTVVHHGPGRRHVTTNTIITSALFALVFAGATAYHYRALDNQKVSITSRFGRSYLLDTDLQELGEPWGSESAFTPSRRDVGSESIRLDENTRWVFPTFRRRELRPETGPDEFLSSRYTWEIVRPGFFVTRDDAPGVFEEEGRRTLEDTPRFEGLRIPQPDRSLEELDK